jgi:hypothetical protein
LVVAQSPGLWEKQEENDEGLLRLVVEALLEGGKQVPSPK